MLPITGNKSMILAREFDGGEETRVVGKTVRRPRRKVDEATKRRHRDMMWAFLYESGESVVSIAETYGFSRMQVYRRIAMVRSAAQRSRDDVD
jgi:hypothetical protein